MRKKFFYTVRHGESLGNINMAEDPDSPLSPKGRTQAAFCAEFISKEINGNAIILSSPFLRCLQTAEFIAEKIKKNIIIEPLIHEFYNEKLFPKKLKFKALSEIAKMNEKIIGNYDNSNWMPEKYETKEDLLKRTVILRNLLISDKHQASSFKKIIIVGHLASIASLIQSMCDIKNLYIDNASVSKILFTDGKFRPEYLNRTNFLS